MNITEIHARRYDDRYVFIYAYVRCPSIVAMMLFAMPFPACFYCAFLVIISSLFCS